jgi:hypothetical protein
MNFFPGDASTVGASLTFASNIFVDDAAVNLSKSLLAEDKLHWS